MLYTVVTGLASGIGRLECAGSEPHSELRQHRRVAVTPDPFLAPLHGEEPIVVAQDFEAQAEAIAVVVGTIVIEREESVRSPEQMAAQHVGADVVLVQPCKAQARPNCTPRPVEGERAAQAQFANQRLRFSLPDGET